MKRAQQFGISLIILGILVFLFVRNSNNNLQTYRNEKYGYEINYPKDVTAFTDYTAESVAQEDGNYTREYTYIYPTGNDDKIIISDSSLEAFEGSEPMFLSIHVLDEFIEEDDFESWLDNSNERVTNLLSHFDSYGYEMFEGKNIFRTRSILVNLSSYGSDMIFNHRGKTILVSSPGDEFYFPDVMDSIRFFD